MTVESAGYHPQLLRSSASRGALRPSTPAMFRQILVHEILEVPAVAHAFPAPLTHKPFPSFLSRMLRKHHAKEALERVVDELPIKRIVQPTDKCVYVCWFGCDIVQPPISTITDVARAVDKNLLQLLVECHLWVGRVSIVLRSHFRIWRQDSLALAHISPGMIGSPGAIGMQRQQVDRHGGSMTAVSAGYHPQLLQSSAIFGALRPSPPAMVR